MKIRLFHRGCKINELPPLVKASIHTVLIHACDSLLQKGIHVHGIQRTCLDTCFTNQAFLLFEGKAPSDGIHIESPGRAYGGTGSAVDAFALIPQDALGEDAVSDSLFIQESQPPFNVLLIACQLYGQSPPFPRGDLSLKNVQDQIEILDQMIAYGLIRPVWREV